MKKSLTVILSVIFAFILSGSVFGSGVDLVLKDGVYYNADNEPVPGITARGIDISSWQKEIDWEKVNREYVDGKIDFVIIRCGYGENLENQDDKQFIRNADACTRYGIPFGVYIYSYAEHPADALSEAEHVLRLINGYTLSYPVMYDVEDETQNSFTSADYVELTDIFFGKMMAEGYEVGLYSYRKRFENKGFFDKIDFDGKHYVKWIAEFNTHLNYSGGVDIWQSNSEGTVDGIEGNVDINYSFIERRTTDHCFVSFSNIDGATGDFTPLHVNKGQRYGWLPTPKKEGYTFTGWYTSEKGGTKVTSSTKLSSCGKQILYARWKAGASADEEPAGNIPEAPSAGSFDIIPSLVSKSPLMLNGLTNCMEYRINGGEWIGGASTRIRDLRGGQTVEIRFRENGNTPAGKILKLYIHAEKLKKIPQKSPDCIHTGNILYYTDNAGNRYYGPDDYEFVDDKSVFDIPETGVHTYMYKCSEECSVCGYTRETEHAFPEYWEGETEIHTKICMECGKTVSESHVICDDKTESNEDSHYQHCEVCGYVFVSPHSWTEYSSVDGCCHTRECRICHRSETTEHFFPCGYDADDTSHWHICETCGEKFVNEHIFIPFKTIEATCDDSGKNITYCEICGLTHIEIIPSHGHVFEEGKCIYCGEEEPEDPYNTPSQTDSSLIDILKKIFIYYSAAFVLSIAVGLTVGLIIRKKNERKNVS